MSGLHFTILLYAQYRYTERLVMNESLLHNGLLLFESCWCIIWHSTVYEPLTCLKSTSLNKWSADSNNLTPYLTLQTFLQRRPAWISCHARMRWRPTWGVCTAEVETTVQVVIGMSRLNGNENLENVATSMPLYSKNLPFFIPYILNIFRKRWYIFQRKVDLRQCSWVKLQRYCKV